MVPAITASKVPRGIISGMDHQRIGRSLRALRQRRGMTQARLAEAAGVSQSLISLIERGHLESVALRTIQRVFAVLDTRLDVQVSWRGGGLDRLLDEAHLALVSRRASTLCDLGWVVSLETTYSVYGERGSIARLDKVDGQWRRTSRCGAWYMPEGNAVDEPVRLESSIFNQRKR